MQSVSVQKQLN